MTREEQAVKAMEEARAGLLASHPFLGYLSFKLTWKPDATCPTAWTDGKEVGYNPEYVLKLSKGQRKFLVAHEVGHPMLGHHLRRNGRDMKKWNIACDYVLNLMLLEQRFQRIDDVLIDYAFKGMASEEAYQKLFGKDQAQDGSKSPQDRSSQKDGSKDQGGQDQQKDQEKGGENDGKDQGDGGTEQQPSQSGKEGGSSGTKDNSPGSENSGTSGTGGEAAPPTSGKPGSGPPGDLPENGKSSFPGGCGEVRDYPGDSGNPSQEEIDMEAEKWDIAIQQAAQITRKLQGHLPGWVETVLTDISEPKLVGEEVIARWIDQQSRDDYSFIRPNNRYSHTGVFLPSMYSHDLGEIAIFWDTSGSVSDDQVADIAAFTISVLDNYPGVTVRLYHIDKLVRHVETLTADTDWSQISAKGRGGTDFRPGFEYLEDDNEINPVGVIYLTDGDCSYFPESEPPIPVLWVIVGMSRYKRFNPPFGEVAYL